MAKKSPKKAYERKKERRAASKAGKKTYTVDGITRSIGSGELGGLKKGQVISRGDIDTSFRNKPKTRLVDGERLDIATGQPFQPKKPVSMLSTDQAKLALQQSQKDQLADMEKLSLAAQKETPQSEVEKPATTTGYTLDELKSLGVTDLSDVQFDEATGTFTPTTPSAVSTEEAQLLDQTKADLKELDTIFKKQEKFIDQASNAVISSLRGIYEKRMNDQRRVNQSQMASQETFGIRSGGSRYAGEVNQGILSARENEGMRRLDEIADLQANAIAEAESARMNKKYALFEDKRREVNALKEERQKQLTELQELAREDEDRRAEIKRQTNLDTAINTLLTEGITSPSDILTALNEAGADYTSKEIADTLKSLNADGNIDKLSGDAREFFTLQQMGADFLPESILALPKNQQLFAYIRMKGDAERKASSGAGGALTTTEAQKLGLPLSLVGKSESEIVGSFSSPLPPSWFKKMTETKLNQTLDPSELQDLWAEFIDDINATYEVGFPDEEGGGDSLY